MADYIRFRLVAARLGVSMAFFALLAGIAERAQAASLRRRRRTSSEFELSPHLPPAVRERRFGNAGQTSTPKSRRETPVR